MKIEKRNNHKKIIIIGGVIVTSALVVGILATSYSKYRVTESIKLGEGIINYSSADFEVVGMYIINEDSTETKIDVVPGNGYILNTEKTKCTVNNIEIAASIEYKDNKLYFGDITKKGTKCKVYFEKEKKQSAGDTIIAGNEPKPGTDEFTGTATTVEDSGLFSTTDNDGTTYYYRGILSDTTINNWLDFAGFKWRIIRINGDGSIRIIYNGTDYSQKGAGTQIGTRAFNSNNSDNAYVGYMYGSTGSQTYTTTHANTNPSYILGSISGTDSGSLNWWYKTNIVDKNYDKYVSKEAGFCGDREVQNTGAYTGNGTKTNWTSYAPLARLYEASNWKTTQTPTLNCTNESNDLYTVPSSSKGNKALTYPIGLITVDEAVFAGGKGGSSNSNFWLTTGQSYWTMSPFSFGYIMDNTLSSAYVFVIDIGGYIYDGCPDSVAAYLYDAVSDNNGVRPVINLSKDVTLTGSGTTTDPFRIA